jgi:hypothetical protein
MRRRTLREALAGLAGVAAAAMAIALWPQPASSLITRQNFDRIRQGITRAEVEAILGSPGDYRTSLGQTDDPLGQLAPEMADYGPTLATWQLWGNGPNRVGVWIGDSVEIIIYVDGSGHVVISHVLERRRNTNPLENFFWRANRLWHRWFPE